MRACVSHAWSASLVGAATTDNKPKFAKSFSAYAAYVHGYRSVFHFTCRVRRVCKALLSRSVCLKSASSSASGVFPRFYFLSASHMYDCVRVSGKQYGTAWMWPWHWWHELLWCHRMVSLILRIVLFVRVVCRGFQIQRNFPPKTSWKFDLKIYVKIRPKLSQNCKSSWTLQMIRKLSSTLRKQSNQRNPSARKEHFLILRHRW